MPNDSPRLVVEDLVKEYRLGDRALRVLDGVSFSLDAGESLAVTGPSGSGKSTLLHLLGGLDRPSSGRVRVAGRDLAEMGERELARFRNREVGFVFQDHHLLPQYTVLENVLLPTLAFPRDRPADAAARARELLVRVGLGERVAHRPAELSGGERQRAAVARALVMQPSLLLGDEPTGSLDRATAARVADLLFDLHRELGTVLVVVTHSPEIATRFPRRFELAEGRCAAA
ncbi:MAG TPA: ABC transporter ATP-binding protein [Thermoanaerobaculia bacterium]|nr:ABC transporter ATP-binding protein [Thermoanaerobaculia bacterium]